MNASIPDSLLSSPLATVSVMRFAHKTATTADGTFPLGDVLCAIRDGVWRLPVEAARGTFLHGTTAAYHAAKGKLPAITFAGTFAPTRSNDNLVTHSGVVLGDVDHVDDPQALKAQLAHDRHIAFGFMSPSGYGLKIGVRVVPVGHAAAYRHAWTVLEAHYATRTGVPWDPAASAVAGLCFVSYGEDLYWNPHAVPFPVPAWVPTAADATTPHASWTARATPRGADERGAGATELAAALRLVAPPACTGAAPPAVPAPAAPAPGANAPAPMPVTPAPAPVAPAPATTATPPPAAPPQPAASSAPGSQPGAGQGKRLTDAQIRATMRSSGRTRREIIEAARAKGFEVPER